MHARQQRLPVIVRDRPQDHRQPLVRTAFLLRIKVGTHGTSQWSGVSPLFQRRGAIYTRESSEEGLEQEFNSLHAQREACEAFVKSQAGEGWRLIPNPRTKAEPLQSGGHPFHRGALLRLRTQTRPFWKAVARAHRGWFDELEVTGRVSSMVEIGKR